MANPHRGQVDIKAGDRTFTLSFSINAMCELEDLMGEPIARIAQGLGDAGSVKISTVRALVWAALRDKHPEVTLEGAGDIIADAGVNGVMEAIGRAFAMAFPEQSKARPRKAAKG